MGNSAFRFAAFLIVARGNGLRRATPGFSCRFASAAAALKERGSAAPDRIKSSEQLIKKKKTTHRMEQVHRHLNILHKQRHQHRPPFFRSPPARTRSPFSETFTTRRFLINFLWCLESIRSNIPLFKTSCLLRENREGRRRKGKGKGEGPLKFPLLLKEK